MMKGYYSYSPTLRMLQRLSHPVMKSSREKEKAYAHTRTHTVCTCTYISSPIYIVVDTISSFPGSGQDYLRLIIHVRWLMEANIYHITRAHTNHTLNAEGSDVIWGWADMNSIYIHFEVVDLNISYSDSRYKWLLSGSLCNLCSS